MTRRTATIFAALACATLIPARGTSAPTGTQVAAVFELGDCKSDPCAAGRDKQVTADSPVHGTIQVDVRSSSSVLGLDWVRLEGQFCRAKACDYRTDDPRWACIEEWDGGGATSLERRVTWQTERWHWPRGKKPPQPWGCSELNWHWHGAPTQNVWFTLHVVARERVNGGMQTSPGFRFRMANPVSPPVWEGNPVASSDPSGRPTVTLEWKPNPEPDVVEYHFARAGPGETAEFVVDAVKPEKQGCRKNQTGKSPNVRVISLLCEDTAFPNTAFTGTYRYVVYAYRPAPSGKSCSLKAEPCFESKASPARSVAVSATAATVSPTATANSGAILQPSPGESSPNAPLAITPIGRGADLDGRPSKKRSTLPGVLGAVLIVTVGAATGRWIRLRRREP